MKKSELKDIQFYEEDGLYYLRLKYILEDDKFIKELEIPKVRVPFNPFSFPEFSSRVYDDFHHIELVNLHTSSGSLSLYPGETSKANHVYYTFKILKEKTTEMTVEEIEKKLGYKIKIVSNHEKESKE